MSIGFLSPCRLHLVLNRYWFLKKKSHNIIRCFCLLSRSWSSFPLRSACCLTAASMQPMGDWVIPLRMPSLHFICIHDLYFICILLFSSPGPRHPLLPWFQLEQQLIRGWRAKHLSPRVCPSPSLSTLTSSFFKCGPLPNPSIRLIDTVLPILGTFLHQSWTLRNIISNSGLNTNWNMFKDAVKGWKFIVLDYLHWSILGPIIMNLERLQAPTLNLSRVQSPECKNYIASSTWVYLLFQSPSGILWVQI